MLSEVCGNFFPPDFGLVIVMQQGNSLRVNESMPSIKYPSVQILFTDTWSLALYFLEVHVLVQMLFQCCEHMSPSPTWAVCSRFQALLYHRFFLRFLFPESVLSYFLNLLQWWMSPPIYSAHAPGNFAYHSFTLSLPCFWKKQTWPTELLISEIFHPWLELGNSHWLDSVVTKLTLSNCNLPNVLKLYH